MCSSDLPRSRKRAEILRAARLFRDDTSYVMPIPAWRAMSDHMGIDNMGGPSVGFLPALPTPSVTYGAVMTHDWTTGAMLGFTYGSATGGAHAGHDMSAMAMPMAMPMPMATPTAESSSTADSTDVVALVTRFHAALAAGDSLAALALLAPDAQILESGSVETVDDYRSHHLAADIAFAKAVTSTRTAPRVTVRGDLAFSASTSVTTGTVRERAVDTAGAELLVARRTAQGWRIAAVHWSSRKRN